MRAVKAKAIRKALEPRPRGERRYGWKATPKIVPLGVAYKFTYQLADDDPHGLYKLGKKIYRSLGILPKEMDDGITESESTTEDGPESESAADMGGR